MWTTSQNTHVLGLQHPFFAKNVGEGVYVDDEHAQLYFENNDWYIQNTSTKYGLTVDGQVVTYKAAQMLQHDNIIELGLSQIQIISHHHIEVDRELKQLLMLDDTHSLESDSRRAGMSLNDAEKGQNVTVGAMIPIEKTTFEDMGLGVHFDEKQFFKEIQSESAHIRTLQTTAKKESLDILDQLAIESELAIINPSLLNKNADYWQSTQAQNDHGGNKIAELEHLFALKDVHNERMVPLDNLERINDLLVNKDNIDKMIGRLDAVDEYALFEDERRIEPLRLFSLENNGIQRYVVQSTPAFTQKEHHTSSMDAYFNSSSESVKKAKPTRNDPQIGIESTDDWIKDFGSSLNDKVSSDDILDSFATETTKK